MERISNFVYKIKCSYCSVEYIGLAVRELNTRITEHKRRINQPVRIELDYQILLKDSAIAGHPLDTGHYIDLKDVEVISRRFKPAQHRLTTKAIEIINSDKAMRRMDGTELSDVWRPVLT